MCSGAERGSRFVTFRTHPARVPRLITFNQHKVSAVACQGCCISVLSYSCDINNLGRHCDVKQTAVCYQQIVWTVVMLRWRCSPPLSLWSSISSSAECLSALCCLLSLFSPFSGFPPCVVKRVRCGNVEYESLGFLIISFFSEKSWDWN